MPTELQIAPDPFRLSAANGEDEGRTLDEARVYLDLTTASARRLVVGRPASAGKSAIIGLFGFADRLRQIWEQAQIGDPYARWWLLRVEQAIADGDAQLHRERTSVAERLSARRSLEVKAGAGRPIERISLLFACPYAYWGARLVGDIDHLIADLDIAAQLGAIIRSEAVRNRVNAERVVRRAFSSVNGYQAFGVNDDAVRHQFPIALDARSALGELPLEVLEGDVWPALLETPPASIGSSK